MSLHKYTFKIKHDKGTIKIQTVANSINSAVEILKVSENMPESSILSIHIKPIK